MLKLIILVIASAGLGFPMEAALAKIIVLKGTYTKERVHIACISAGGESNAGRVPAASDVRRPRARLNAMRPGRVPVNANTAELAKSNASGIFCARVTASRRPALDRTTVCAGTRVFEAQLYADKPKPTRTCFSLFSDSAV